MNKKKIHHILKELSNLKTWQLIVIALLFTVVSIGLLRHNSVTAVQKFEQVKQADENGNHVYKELRDLQSYVSNHMNTQIERVTLTQTYAREYQKALEKASQAGGVNQNANYDAAQAACADLQQTAGYVPYVRCVEDRLAQVAPGENPELEADLPEPAFYQYSFVSPAWSPDAAGIMLLITVVIWLVIIIKIILQITLKTLLKRKHA